MKISFGILGLCGAALIGLMAMLAIVLPSSEPTANMSEPTARSEAPSSVPASWPQPSIPTHAIEDTQSTFDLPALRLALSNGDSEDRGQAAVALGRAGHADAVPPLSLALADSDADVREVVIFSLAEIGGADSARALGIALHDNDPRIREQVVNALGDIGGETAVALLELAQTDEVVFVRLAAAEKLEQLRASAR